MKFGILEKSSYYVPGDERSLTNSGHGYKTLTDFHEFETELDLEEYLKKRSRDLSKFRVIQFQEMNVGTEVIVKLS